MRLLILAAVLAAGFYLAHVAQDVNRGAPRNTATLERAGHHAVQTLEHVVR